ncbi:hypothetical protein FOCC_FOCC011799 [Frankliniella occidentalis]|nr:hypothetical protein FOCC_FOCC011799 [Frankliniella occidentalis]
MPAPCSCRTSDEDEDSKWFPEVDRGCCCSLQVCCKIQAIFVVASSMLYTPMVLVEYFQPRPDPLTDVRPRPCRQSEAAEAPQAAAAVRAGAGCARHLQPHGAAGQGVRLRHVAGGRGHHPAPGCRPAVLHVAVRLQPVPQDEARRGRGGGRRRHPRRGRRGRGRSRVCRAGRLRRAPGLGLGAARARRRARHPRGRGPGALGAVGAAGPGPGLPPGPGPGLRPPALLQARRLAAAAVRVRGGHGRQGPLARLSARLRTLT